MNTLRVAIFDDNANVRQSIALLLQTTEKFEVVGSFSSARNCVKDVEFCKPDIILMDIEMPDITGIEAVKLIKVKHAHIEIIMQTVFEDDERVFNSICAGATGYLLKSNLTYKLLDALEEISQGGAPMSPGIANKVLNKMKTIAVPSKVSNTDYKLTTREQEVLLLIVDGLSHKMISSELNISYDTVRSHVKKIYSKLHVASLSEAVAKALKQKLV